MHKNLITDSDVFFIRIWVEFSTADLTLFEDLVLVSIFFFILSNMIVDLEFLDRNFILSLFFFNCVQILFKFIFQLVRLKEIVFFFLLFIFKESSLVLSTESHHGKFIVLFLEILPLVLVLCKGHLLLRLLLGI